MTQVAPFCFMHEVYMKTELLAPAGSIEGLKAVIAAGADAVYIGGTKFGARAYADNPDEDDLLDAIDYAHLRGVKVYMTVNTLLKDNEIKELPAYLAPYVERGLDAVLVQDFGVLALISRTFPDLPLHASTQMTVTGPFGASLLKEYGVVRVVPARELSLRELSRIRRESGLEVEAFVHGALCYSYSGMCLFSSMLGGRSGNRGRCAQPCRLSYRLKSEGRTAAGELLSLKDLNTLEHLPELVRAGVSSLKIEGRMKRPEYAAGVVRIYRKYLDLYESRPESYRVDPADAKSLGTLFSRTGFTDGYLNRRNGRDMMTEGSRELARKEEEERNRLYEVIRDAYMTKEDTVPLTGDAVVRAGEDMIMRASCRGVSVSVRGAAAEKARSAGLSVQRIREQLTKTGGSGFHFTEFDVTTDGEAFVPIGALNQLRREALLKIKEELLASGRRGPYSLADEAGEARPASRNATGKAWSLAVLVSENEQLAEALKSPDTDTVIAEASLLYGRDWRRTDSAQEALSFIDRCKKAGKRAEIALPYVVRESEGSALIEAAGILSERGLSAFLVRNLESMARLIAAGCGYLVKADTSLYTMNREAEAFLKGLGIAGDTVPFELNRKEIMRRDNEGSRITVYGRIPLMVTAQCLRKNSSGCTKEPGYVTLTDRKGVHFPVNCDCAFCTNIIYNSEYLSLLGEADALRAAGFTEAVLCFTDESGEVTQKMLKTASDVLIKGGQPEALLKYTKGHYNRGVE